MDSQHVSSELRSFNRFYTNFLGLVDNQILESPLSLAESRILYEIAQVRSLQANDLAQTLTIDKGYLSRVLRKFEKQRLISKSVSSKDKRALRIRITNKGLRTFDHINRASEHQINELIKHLGADKKEALVDATKQIKSLLSSNRFKSINLEDILIRNTLEPGDIGFITYSHSQLYKKEYSYDIMFEAYVAQGMLEFYQSYNEDKDQIWICEYGGKRIGSLLSMNRGNVAQLRYFLIYPEYRGIGLGKELIKRYMTFLKDRGYSSSYLWTTNEQSAAAHLYTQNGYKLIEEVPSTRFGKALMEQKYELVIT